MSIFILGDFKVVKKYIRSEIERGSHMDEEIDFESYWNELMVVNEKYKEKLSAQTTLKTLMVLGISGAILKAPNRAEAITLIAEAFNETFDIIKE